MRSTTAAGQETADTAKVPQLTLGWRLRMSLEAAGIKADDMAARLHVHRGTITRWTHDVGSPPKPIYLERWAEVTGVPYKWLLLGNADSSQATGRDTHRYVAGRRHSYRHRPGGIAA